MYNQPVDLELIPNQASSSKPAFPTYKKQEAFFRDLYESCREQFRRFDEARARSNEKARHRWVRAGLSWLLRA
jgi:hypothetical protein